MGCCRAQPRRPSSHERRDWFEIGLSRFRRLAGQRGAAVGRIAGTTGPDGAQSRPEQGGQGGRRAPKTRGSAPHPSR